MHTYIHTYIHTYFCSYGRAACEAAGKGVGTCRKEAAEQKIRASGNKPEKPTAEPGGDRKKSAGGGHKGVHDVTDWMQRQGRQLHKQGQAVAVSMT